MDKNKVLCTVCMQEVDQPSGRGRPRAHHDTCGDVLKYQAAWVRAVEAISPQLEPQARAKLRSSVQSALNSALNPGKGAKQKYRDQPQKAECSRFGGSRKKSA